MTKVDQKERAEKRREARVRQMVARNGYMLQKCRSRNVDSVEYGLYMVIDPATGGTVNPSIAQRWNHSWTLDDVEAWFRK